ncbi:hypothetical protein ACH5RR_021785 [Cinchona calisaya]|uniref:Uncharacterized protein n=1 Tax=Cinchona calisaya TaxID=153742 RepID=A0ABD2ZIC9_9GENT
MLGAKIATSAFLDTTDITDSSLVSIGEESVIAEGALLQSHEVGNGILSFTQIQIGQKSFVGPYAVIQKGSRVRDGAEVFAVQTCEGSSDSKNSSANIVQKLFFDNTPSNSISFAFLIASSYAAHGLILSFFTCILNSYLHRGETKEIYPKSWFAHWLNVACHIRFANFLSGTEAFATYLRLLGAKIGQNCSIRSINPVLDPELISIGDGVHLGDSSRLTPGYYSPDGYTSGRIEIQDNSVLGSESLILPGSVIEKDVILGAISVAPRNSVLQRGGVFRLTSSSNGLPNHKIFSPGKSYPIIILHSNCLSSDDDVRLDPCGTAIWILSNEADEKCQLLDLTLKTGKAFHPLTIDYLDSRMDEMYVKFKLRPFDDKIGEDSGKSQIRPVPEDKSVSEIALDYTRPWDETEFPYIEVREIIANEMLTEEESQALEFNPFFQCHEVDVIQATSYNQSASIDHCRSVVYEICQHLKKREPLAEAWRIFLDNSDVKLDFSGCKHREKGHGQEKYGCVEKEALIFGHIYEGQGGKAKYGKIKIEEGGFIGSRTVAMPGVIVDTGGKLGVLSLAVKGEIVM